MNDLNDFSGFWFIEAWKYLAQVQCPPLPCLKQESRLPQTDRATRYVSRNRVICRNKLYNKSTLELEGYCQTSTTRARLGVVEKPALHVSPWTLSETQVCEPGLRHSPLGQLSGIWTLQLTDL